MQGHKPHITPHLYAGADEFFYCEPVPEDPFDPARQEKNLLKAVLSRAICDATGNSGEGKLTQMDALEWVFRPLDYCTPFTFGYICLTLDLDPEVIRDFLKGSTKPLYKGKGKPKNTNN